MHKTLNEKICVVRLVNHVSGARVTEEVARDNGLILHRNTNT